MIYYRNILHYLAVIIIIRNSFHGFGVYCFHRQGKRIVVLSSNPSTSHILHFSNSSVEFFVLEGFIHSWRHLAWYFLFFHGYNITSRNPYHKNTPSPFSLLSFILFRSSHILWTFVWAYVCFLQFFHTFEVFAYFNFTLHIYVFFLTSVCYLINNVCVSHDRIKTNISHKWKININLTTFDSYLIATQLLGWSWLQKIQKL